MGIKTVPHRPYSPDLAPCDFWLFPKLRGCRYETIEEMKEVVTKVIDTLTQEDVDENIYIYICSLIPVGLSSRAKEVNVLLLAKCKALRMNRALGSR